MNVLGLLKRTGLPAVPAGVAGLPMAGVRLSPKEQAYVEVIQRANQAASQGNLVRP